MDDEGNPTAAGNLERQMKKVYSDLDAVLGHFAHQQVDDVLAFLGVVLEELGAGSI
jgi:hypothetical protein